jgi:hypothetical protein
MDGVGPSHGMDIGSHDAVPPLEEPPSLIQ